MSELTVQLRLLTLLLLALALSGGCYCPMLSGRYGEACPPFGPPAACQPPCTSVECQHCDHLGQRRGVFLSRAKGQVPSQQAYDYISPQPKFHPVPTRPVFEPATSL
jgi:hypothetical protein